jgi:hypothetical protein
MPPSRLSRRDFLASCLVIPAVAFLPHDASRCDSSRAMSAHRGDHPTPRPGIGASRVPKASELADAPRAIVAFDEVRSRGGQAGNPDGAPLRAARAGCRHVYRGPA